jgi:serine/threonine protein kinase
LFFTNAALSPCDTKSALNSHVVRAWDKENENFVVLKVLKRYNCGFMSCLFTNQGSFQERQLNNYLQKEEVKATKLYCQPQVSTRQVKSLYSCFPTCSITKRPCFLELKEVYETRKRLIMVFPYCEDGDLQQKMKKSPSGRLTEEEVKVAFAHVLKALGIMHRSGRAHGNINVTHLFNTENVLKLNSNLSTNFSFPTSFYSRKKVIWLILGLASMTQRCNGKDRAMGLIWSTGEQRATWVCCYNNINEGDQMVPV